MSKDAYYFSHDAGARNDPKISAMRMEYKSEGYGWFWIIIEVLREQEEYRLPCKDYIWNALAMQMQCTKEECIDFVSACTDRFELFESNGEFFWSNSLIKRMTARSDVSEKRRMAAKKRWDSPQKEETVNANAMQMHANAMQTDARKGKEIKGKENKVNNNPPISPLRGVESDQKKNVKEDKIHRLEVGFTFNDFWEAYDKKRGSKEETKKQWDAMSLADKQTAMLAIPKYKEHQPDKNYRLDPVRYLKRRAWEYDLTPKQTTPNNPQKQNGYGNPISNKYDPDRSLAAAQARWGS